MEERNSSIMPITAGIIVICVFVFLKQLAEPSFTSEYALSAGALMQGRYITLLTSMFMHGGFQHILLNMLSLWAIATFFKNAMNGFEYILVYLLSGIAGGLLWCYVSMQNGELLASCVGASGAIFGLIGAQGAFLLKMKHDGYNVSNAWQSWISVLGINLVYGIMDPSIALNAHIGGLICGFILGGIIAANKHIYLSA